MRHLDGRSTVASRLPRPWKRRKARHQKADLGIGEELDDLALLRVVGNEAAGARIFLSFAGRHETKKQTPRRVLLRRRQPIVGGLRRLLDRAGHAADCGVGFGGELFPSRLSHVSFNANCSSGRRPSCVPTSFRI